jgi:2-C-methyl-D-erythritol 4-phosphate cytidylyltransferase
VADSVWQEFILQHIDFLSFTQKFKGFSTPGENRQLSIVNGLKSIREYAEEEDTVLVHDAARPLLTYELTKNCLQALDGCEGVLPVLPMKDTVYLSEDGESITSLLDRKQIFAGQAPEAFRLGAYYRANEALMPEKILQINGSTEPAVMMGLHIRMIPGDEQNFKITTREDLKRFEEIISKRQQ